jgi:membrane protein implicated in regulation of membrane protease activity
VTSNDRDDDRSVDEDDRISELRGTVRSVDQDRRVMELEDTSWGFGSDRDRDDGDLVRVYYDSSTRVEYDGRSYRPENLERGDEVRVDVRRDGSRYEADEIQVVENVRD